MSRHPYTHAADFIRSLGPVGDSGVVLSRSDATQIMRGIAESLGIDAHELACRLSDHFQANQVAIRAHNLGSLAIGAHDQGAA
jgi:hypothetical protein